MTKSFNGTLKVTFLDFLDKTFLKQGWGEKKSLQVFVADEFHSLRFDCTPCVEELLFPFFLRKNFLNGTLKKNVNILNNTSLHKRQDQHICTSSPLGEISMCAFVRVDNIRVYETE